MAPPFQLYHLMHMTVILLNITREWVPSEDKEASSVFLRFFLKATRYNLIVNNMCKFV